MNRRAFHKSIGAIAAGMMLRQARQSFEADASDRLTMSTVNFRERFAQTKTSDVAYKSNPLTLLDIPAYFRQRFGLTQVEFWSKHFESIDPKYLQELKAAVRKSKSRLV